jgi:hypothetical protein
MLAPTRPLKLQTGNLRLQNWVRFAHFASGARPRRAKLGSFCASTLRPGHATHDDGLCPYSPVPPSLASFCTIGPRPGAPCHPAPPGIGFVLHDSALRGACPRPDRGLPRHGVPLRGRPARLLPPVERNWVRFAQSAHAPGPRPTQPAGNWVRFAHLPSGRAKLGSFCAFTLRPGQIGFVLRISLPGRATPHTTRAFAHIALSPQIWLRFAQFPPSPAYGWGKLGSFRTRAPFVVTPSGVSSPHGHPAEVRRRARCSPNALTGTLQAGPNWLRFARRGV